MADEYTVVLVVEGALDADGLDAREVQHGCTEVRMTVNATSAVWAVTAARRKLSRLPGDDHRAILYAVAMPSWDYRKRVDQLPLPALVSVARAAEMLGTGRQRVRQLVDDGQLPAAKLGRDWVLRAADVEARRERRERYQAMYEPAGAGE